MVVLGCGGGKAPDPVDPDDVAVRPPPPDACAETAALLDDTPRLAAELRLDDTQRRAASAEYVALLTEACRSHGWPTAVIDCVRNAAGADELTSCLDQLPTAARKAHGKLVADFRAEQEAKVAAARPRVPACASVAKTPAPWLARAPEGDVAGFAQALVELEVGKACTFEAWSETDRACFGAAASAAEIARCREALGEAARSVLDTTQTELAARIDAVAALVAEPARIACDKVADRFYADAIWRGSMKGIRTKARAKALAAAEKAMAAACDTEQWSAVARACFATAASPGAIAPCSPDERWRNAPGETLTSTGVRACDAYFAELTRQKLACKTEPAAIARELAKARMVMVELPEDDAAAQCKLFGKNLETNPVTCAAGEAE